MSSSFIIVVLLFIFSSAKGESLVIGSPQIIRAAPHDDVILPCHLDPPFNVEGLTVEWSKPDLKPDPSDRLSRVEYVHLYRDRREVTDMKLPSYVSRTSLFTDDLKHGNISLKISNVTLADTGRYRCFIPKLQSRVKESVVQLVVDLDFAKTSSPETPLHPGHNETGDPKDSTDDTGARSSLTILIPVMFSVILLTSVIGGLGGYFYKQQHEEQKQNLKLEGDLLDQQESGLLSGASCQDKDVSLM
ncbi:myelin-oligodendrocyte glycoprotein-like isoform X3 [Anabas testudineus]|uniref:myelin-oligodendrocyte glycoprotein-like isoform X3 n=1 Tax=Anabas testudineus TaxID=64144 RepID=UPI000E4608CB|nr:myelin-oligodendrocyte glycoprotein-like isoform X3 [Anabas testudineus]